MSEGEGDHLLQGAFAMTSDVVAMMRVERRTRCRRGGKNGRDGLAETSGRSGRFRQRRRRRRLQSMGVLLRNLRDCWRRERRTNETGIRAASFGDVVTRVDGRSVRNSFEHMSRYRSAGGWRGLRKRKGRRRNRFEPAKCPSFRFRTRSVDGHERRCSR